MANYNKCLQVGRLTRDPELRAISSGTSICNFSIANSRKYGDKDETLFLEVIAWGKTGEIAEKYLKKGSSVLIEGRLKLDTWDDKNTGVKRSKISLVAEKIEFLDSRSIENREAPSNVPKSVAKKAAPAYSWDDDSYNPGEPPF